jgi:A/G-specific adenine glycosylase
MLQQTRVEAVIPYFERFTAVLPDVAALATVEEHALMKLWEGLGYYSRARNLQRAARQIMEHHGGVLPADYDALRALTGFGDYTAGAVASIAFGLPHPAVDGNVLRVCSRLAAWPGDIKSPTARRGFADALRSQLDARPGDVNQALMELGATVCLPNGKPLCDRCPLADRCRALALGAPLAYPRKGEKRPRRAETRTVLVVTGPSGALLRLRAGKGLLAGLWELPNEAGALDAAQAHAALAAMGLSLEDLMPLPPAKHIFTHVQWNLSGFLARVGDTPTPQGCVWASSEELGTRYALPSAFKAYRGPLLRAMEEK